MEDAGNGKKVETAVEDPQNKEFTATLRSIAQK
jgi:hypothetical protein